MTVHPYYLTPDDYDVAAKKGISPRALEQRRDAGWSKERALSQLPKVPNPFPSDLVSKAKAHGVRYETLSRRIRVLGWDADVAATTPPLAHGRKLCDTRMAD